MVCMRGLNLKNRIWRPDCFTQDEWLIWKKHDDAVGYKVDGMSTTSVCKDCLSAYRREQDALNRCSFHRAFRIKAVQRGRERNVRNKRK